MQNADQEIIESLEDNEISACIQKFCEKESSPFDLSDLPLVPAFSENSALVPSIQRKEKTSVIPFLSSLGGKPIFVLEKRYGKQRCSLHELGKIEFGK